MRIKNFFGVVVSLEILMLTAAPADAQSSSGPPPVNAHPDLISLSGGLTAATQTLNASAAAAYPAVQAALAKDPRLAASFATEAAAGRLEPAIRSMLPDHAGGAFEVVVGGSRALSHHLTDPGAPSSEEGKTGLWLEQAMWFGSKGVGNTSRYVADGWGAALGAERKTAFGTFGISVAYGHGSDDDRGNPTTVATDLYLGGFSWKGEGPRFRPFVAISYGHVDLSSSRSFGASRDGDGLPVANASWKGELLTSTGGFSYVASIAGLSIRPVILIDYARLTEGEYAETGGGSGFDLTVDSRTSDELTARGTVALGKRWSHESSWLSLELEAGRRAVVSGALGNTTARFDGGQTFTLIPEKRTDGWVGAIRVAGGAYGFRFSGDLGAEQQFGRAAVSARAGVRFGL